MPKPGSGITRDLLEQMPKQELSRERPSTPPVAEVQPKKTAFEKFPSQKRVPQSKQPPQEAKSVPPSDSSDPYEVHVPPNVHAAFRTPLRHPLTHGVPVASLQLRSYSVRNLEFYADFCVRAAYYLGLPCRGPTPLPRITQRWTVLKSNFVNKKSQENFERITMRRLISVYDGEPSVVEVWLAFLRKWQFYGVGMKANVWQFEGLGMLSFSIMLSLPFSGLFYHYLSFDFQGQPLTKWKQTSAPKWTDSSRNSRKISMRNSVFLASTRPRPGMPVCYG